MQTIVLNINKEDIDVYIGRAGGGDGGLTEEAQDHPARLLRLDFISLIESGPD